jgi:hypothetical protein
MIILDKAKEICSNTVFMKQNDRKNTGNWWWPEEILPAGKW